MSAPSPFALKSEHLCSLLATLQAPPEVIGPVPGGVRANFYVTGGEVKGPRLNGKLRAVGGDWFLLRSDGVGELDVQLTLETGDGALIEVRYHGRGDFGAEGYARFLKGELPPSVPLHTAPRFRTAHPGYQWLHRPMCVGVGVADLQRFEVRYDIYALT